MFWLALGVASVGYGVRGERIPGKMITLTEDMSDNDLRTAERAFWIVSGMCELAYGILELRARY